MTDYVHNTTATIDDVDYKSYKILEKIKILANINNDNNKLQDRQVYDAYYYQINEAMPRDMHQPNIFKRFWNWLKFKRR